jgi:hypothetical protein
MPVRDKDRPGGDVEIADKLKDHAHKLKVLRPEQLQFEQFRQLWNDDKANRLDYYMSSLRRLVQVGDILPVAKTQFWPQLGERWITAQRKLQEGFQAVEQDLDAANVRFQDLYLANYVKWIHQADAPPIFTHQFVPRVLKTHWDPQSGQKAVILLFDGLRVDAWEDLVRPILEEEYDVIEQLAGSSSCRARPSSAARRSPRAAFPPAFAVRRRTLYWKTP